MSAFFELEGFFLLHFSVVFSTWIYKLFIWSKLTFTVTVIRYSSDLEYIDTLVISFWHACVWRFFSSLSAQGIYFAQGANSFLAFRIDCFNGEQQFCWL